MHIGDFLRQTGVFNRTVRMVRLDRREHLEAELTCRPDREIGVQPHGKLHVVVQQGTEKKGQPSFGQQNFVRVRLQVVYEPAVPSLQSLRRTRNTTQCVRVHYERVCVQHG